MVFVFVYGTLKKGFPNHYLLVDETKGNATFVSNGYTVNKFPLVVTTPFFIPFLLDKENQGDYVNGEIYEVDDQMLCSLDKLEANKQLYFRTPIQIKTATEVVTCEAYILPDFKESLLELTLLKSYDDSSKYVPPSAQERKLEELLLMVKNPKRTLVQ